MQNRSTLTTSLRLLDLTVTVYTDVIKSLVPSCVIVILFHTECTARSVSLSAAILNGNCVNSTQFNNVTES